MNILIIEDNKSKYKNLEDTLNRVVDNPSITWEQSRNNGLVAIKEHNFINDNDLDDTQFYNRVDEISFLSDNLELTKKGSTPTILLTGIRGVGKSALMKKLKKKSPE